MKYAPYPAYKDSGVEWLGKIPEGWGAAPLKRKVVLVAGIGFPPDEQGFSGNELPFYKVKDLGYERASGVIGETEHSISRSTAEKIRAKIIPSGTIVFAKVGMAIALNRFCFTDVDCCMDNNMMGAIPLGIERTFLRYLFPVLRIPDYMNPGAVPSLNEGIIGQIVTPLPPLPTQQAIAAFLDTETARIDSLIKDYEELISLLREKRQALISHAVTRGLSELVAPDDPEFGEWAKPVKFKDSGVEWLGEIPEGWRIPALSYHYEVQLGKMLDATQITGSQLFPYLRNQDVQWGKINLEELPEMDFSSLEQQKYRLKKGDLLVCEGGDVGRAAVWEHDEIPCFYQKALHRIRPLNRTENDPRYLLFLLMMANKNGIFVGGEEKATIYHLTADHLRKFRLPLPQKGEQQAIAAFLDKETAKIDALVSEAESAIELLKEHRAALITNAVTGKINVEGLA